MAIIQLNQVLYVVDTQAETRGVMFPSNSLIYCIDTKSTLECKSDGSGFLTITSLLGAPTATTAAVTVNANANTIVAGGLNVCKIPANSINIGTSFRSVILGSFTGTATATAIQVHLGTAGTTADAVILTASVTGAVGTCQCRIVIEFTFRTIGASGSVFGSILLTQATATGLGNATVIPVVCTTTTAPNTTVDNWLTISLLSAASGSSGTTQNGTIELIKS